jgi:hypothetical protein
MKKLVVCTLLMGAVAVTVLIATRRSPQIDFPGNVTVTHSGYQTTTSAVQIAVLSITNAGPHTFYFALAAMPTDGSRPAFFTGTSNFMSLLRPGEAASLPVPIPPVSWTAYAMCRPAPQSGLMRSMIRFAEENDLKSWDVKYVSAHDTIR